MTIQAETMDSIDRKLPGLSERERKIISKHTKSIINQMLKDPIKQAKELSSDKKSNEKLELFQNIFDIEAECPHEQAKQQKKARSRKFQHDVSLVLNKHINMVIICKKTCLFDSMKLYY